MKGSWRTLTTLGCVSLCAAWLALGGASGCASTNDERQAATQAWTISGAPRIFGAEGRVRVRVDDDDNHVVDLAFDHLAPANQAFAGTSVYMIWLVPRGGAPRSVGIITGNDARQAALTITTPYEDFDIVVTAESLKNPATPSANRAFAATITSPVS